MAARAARCWPTRSAISHISMLATPPWRSSRGPHSRTSGAGRPGWAGNPWYTLTDSFDADFGVDEWHGTNAFLRDRDQIFRTYCIDARGRGDGEHLGLPRYHGPRASRRSGGTRRRATRRPRRMRGGTCTTSTARSRERPACDTLGMTVSITRPKLEGNIAVGDDLRSDWRSSEPRRDAPPSSGCTEPLPEM